MQLRKSFVSYGVFSLGCVAAGLAQEWLNYAGDAQRTSWQRNEKYLKAENVKGLKLLWKRRLDDGEKGLNSLTAPAITGPIITHRGIKELVLVGGGSDNVYAVDADLGRVFWTRHFAIEAGATQLCGTGLATTPMIAPPEDASAKVENDEPSQMRPVYVLSGDGALHRIRPSDGEDVTPPQRFIPQGANSSSLNVAAGHIYTTTSGGCAGVPNGVWAIGAKTPSAKATFFPSHKSNVPVKSGVSIGFDGGIYTAFGAGRWDPPLHGFANAVFSLAPASLKMKDYFTSPEPEAIGEKYHGSLTPIAFQWKGRNLLAVAGRTRIFLLDTGGRLGGESHEQPLATSDPLKSEGEFPGDIATWEDTRGVRWIYAVASGRPSHGTIIAYKVTEKDHKPAIERAWVSRDILAPLCPVVVNGIVFALASGEFTGMSKTVQEKISKSTHATLYALDAGTGRELYSSGDIVTSFTHSSGLAVANGHVCFGTWDNTLYCFGFPIEI